MVGCMAQSDKARVASDVRIRRPRVQVQTSKQFFSKQFFFVKKKNIFVDLSRRTLLFRSAVSTLPSTFFVQAFLKEKNFHPKKSLSIVLHQAIQLYKLKVHCKRHDR